MCNVCAHTEALRGHVKYNLFNRYNAIHVQNISHKIVPSAHMYINCYNSINDLHIAEVSPNHYNL